MRCRILGHRPKEPVGPDQHKTYQQQCKNCEKFQTFQIGEQGRYNNSKWFYSL